MRMGKMLLVVVCSYIYILHVVPTKSFCIFNGSLNHMSGIVRVCHYACLEVMCVASVIY